ncbi:hypothetical protein ACQP0C_25795 [Nocardia sp. CA-129566]|uniref:hypothetical protein n=1 Tax=Nocardia sp. CA-129566 TaxID=3239976 RepID=UPI003D99A428
MTERHYVGSDISADEHTPATGLFGQSRAPFRVVVSDGHDVTLSPGAYPNAGERTS